ncbi:MAG: hypothetical protein JO255_08260, partial [Alphaproteobacteria bacterium]|nr:hypothetical protein [Alphaproteobacteria bacterium]
DPARLPFLADELSPFRAHPDAVALMEAEAWKRTHRREARLRRSLAKRKAWLQRCFARAIG